jgi:O-antigen/teichoic acid export membrane protein
MQAYNEYGKLNVLRTLNAIANTVGLLAIVYLGGRIVEMMQWTVIASVVLLVLFSIGAILLLKGARITPQWNGAKGKDILSYSLTSWGAALGGTMFTRFDRLIIGSILGTSILGVYAAITDIAVQINSFSALAVQPVLPTLSFELVKKEVKTEHIEDKIKQALQINMLVALILGAGLIIFAPVIVEVLLSGSTVVNQIFVFRAAIIIYSLYSLNAAGYFVLYSVNAVSEVLWTQLIVGVVTLVCIALGATYFGLRGAIFSNVVYIGTGWLTIRSMNHYNIPASKWLKWIVFPLACFFSLVLLVFVSPEHLSLHMIALFSTTMILGIWFFNLQRESIGISLSKLEKTP